MTPVGTLEPQFPTRQYRFRSARPSGHGIAFSAATDEPLVMPSEGSVARFILGQDQNPEVIAPDQIANTLHDPFAQLVLAGGSRPYTVRALLASLGEAALPEQKSFVVADGGQILWTAETDAMARDFRF